MESKGQLPVRPVAKSKAQLQDDSIMGVSMKSLRFKEGCVLDGRLIGAWLRPSEDGYSSQRPRSRHILPSQTALMLTYGRRIIAASCRSAVSSVFTFQPKPISSAISSKSHRGAHHLSIVDIGLERKPLIKSFASSSSRTAKNRRLSSILDADSKQK